MGSCNRTVIFLLPLLLLCAGTMAQNVVVVQPGAMNGWDYLAHQYATGFLTNILPDPVSAPMPSGMFAGAFYGETTGTGSGVNTVPDQVWLGTDAYNGVRCADIDTLTYKTYTEPSGWQVSTQHYVKQPFMLQMTINESGSGGATRLLIYRPWGLRDPVNGQNLANYGVWQTHNCMAPVPRVPDPRADPSSPYYDWRYDPNDTLHYDGSLAGPGTVAENPDLPGWYEAQTGFYGDWDFWFGTNGWYPNATIVAANGADTTWTSTTVTYTGTGKSMNFQVGGRKRLSRIYNHPEYLDLDNKPPMEEIATWEKTYTWWAEGARFKGYVDDFTIGVNGATTTYDFQGGAAPMTLCLTSNKAIKDYCADRGKVKFYYRVHGRVVADGWSTDEFILQDASGQRVKVKAVQHGMFKDDYVSAAGKVDTSTDPPTLTTSYERLNYYPEF